ncbi:salicylate hydroxylase [Lasiosphaeria hispida]|uniref:Salicylate hydroxylase n=1 Tax=Lasiosphaeria hispida TaxID=260671 RepID=A0AAJ0HTD2_9PEZI|nr:salicylate hydroxylase [Lasiosphaeria hispida]
MCNPTITEATAFMLRDRPTPAELAKPSGMLDLHQESGLKVIRSCGLWDSFEAAAGDCSEATRVFSPDGTLLHSDDGGIEPRPEIPRNAIADMLIQNLPPDTIKWKHKITSATSTQNTTTGAFETTLDLGPHGTATFDFVVGADGAWSRIRPLLTDVKPLYSGAQNLTATIRNASTNYPHLVELNGSGTIMALGGGKAIMTHRGPHDSICVYAAISTPQENWVETAGLQGKTAAEIKATLLEDEKLFGSWAPKLKELLATACDEDTKDHPGREADVKPISMLPIGHRWEHRAGATLIGDAAHLMMPWAGEGANLALWDSLELADALAGMPEVTDAAAWQVAVEPRVRKFEGIMLKRATEKAKETDRNRSILLSKNGGHLLAYIFKAVYGFNSLRSCLSTFVKRAKRYAGTGRGEPKAK